MSFRQGDTYSLQIKLTTLDGIITGDDVRQVEFTLGQVRKVYPEDVTFDTDHFVVSLTQEDTFGLQGLVRCQARVMFIDGSVKGTGITTEAVLDSISRVVLKNA